MDEIKKKIYQGLRWSEKYTQTDMVYVAKGGSWLLFGQIMSSVSAFLLSIAFANFLDKEAFGTYQYVLSIVSLLAIPTLGEMVTSLTKSIAQGKDGAILSALKTRIKWGLIGSLFSVGLAVYYHLNGNSILSISFLISAVFLPIMDPLTVYTSILSGKKLFKKSTIYNLISNISLLICMVVVMVLTQNIILILFTYFITNTLVRFLLLRRSLNKIELNKLDDAETIPYGKHLSFMGIFGTISSQLDKILLWQFIGAQAVAVYSLALSPVSRIQSLLKPIESLAFPKLADKNLDELKKTLPKKVLKFLIITTLITAVYMLLAPYLYRLLFPQYIESIKYSQILALIIIFYPQKIVGAALTAHGDKKALYAISIINPLVRIMGFLILLPIYGIMGAVYSMLIPYLVNTIILFYFFSKPSNPTLREVSI